MILPDQLNIHASTVAWGRSAVVILGPPGSGKSALALTLMAWGCGLVADDRTILESIDGKIIARAPAPIRGLIEARGVGLIRAVPVAEAEVILAVDLGQTSTDRLPPPRTATWFGITVPLFHKVEASHFPAAILQYLKADQVPHD
jgi:HPr kinase/phosphorylase